VQVGDQRTQAHSEGTLGLYKSLLGDFSEALAHLQAAIVLENELSMPRAVAESLTVLSALYEQWGRYPEAVEAAHRAVELIRGLGRHESALVALTDLAAARLGLGELDLAEVCLAEARESCDDTREPGQVALTLALSAEIAYRCGESDLAVDYADQATKLIQQSASPLRRAKVTNVLGRLQRGRGNPAAALDLHVQAYEVAAAVRFRVEEAYALSGMAAAADALGDAAAAQTHRAAAEELFALLGVPADRRRRPVAPAGPAAAA
jgi:tetratricopeptide (TPR) repeat protein